MGKNTTLSLVKEASSRDHQFDSAQMVPAQDSLIKAEYECHGDADVRDGKHGFRSVDVGAAGSILFAEK
ncbi:hypothetical protein V5G24_00565 [Xanthobacter sp. VTT E-85241]|uniref:hypothetical protein n=1 Tax=Roseixanthobacter finlandensis TaxID=3119922 RepID=UPI00372A1C24